MLGFRYYRHDIDSYMTRWVLVLPTGHGIRLHRIRRPDLDRDHHDHPWSFLSIVLWGGYDEIITRRDRVLQRPVVSLSSRTRRWLSVAFTAAEQAHRIARVRPRTLTLVLSSPERREWGFWRGGEWIPWRRYIEQHTAKDVTLDNYTHKREQR